MNRKPLVPAAIVSTYESMAEQIRSSHHGSGLLCSSTTLLPIVFYTETAPTIPTARLVSTNGGESYDISGDLFQRWTIDNTQCWYLWNVGQSMGFTVASGSYYLVLDLGTKKLYTEELNCCPICSPMNLDIILNAVAIQSTPFYTINFNISAVTGLGVAVDYIGVLDDGNIVEQSVGGVLNTNRISSPVYLKRVVESSCGSFSADFTLSFDHQNPVDTAVIDKNSELYHPILDSENVWYIEIADTNDKGNIPYVQQFKQRFYFKPAPSAPSVDDDFSYLANGDGKQHFEKSILKDNIVFEVHNLPDSIIAPLTFSRHASTKKLVNTVTGFELDFAFMSVDFTPSADPNYTTGVFTIQRSILVQRSCMPVLDLRTPL